MHHSQLYLLAALPLACCLRVNVSQDVPLSGTIDPLFLGFGIEVSSLPDYTGNETHPNEFSLNMFSAISNRTGTLPIRVGGTSMDHSIYDPSQKQVITFPDNHTEGHRSNATIGPSLFDSFSMIDNVRWIFQVPLGRNRLDNAIEFTKAALAKIPKLEALEIGNEPNLYPKDVRGPNYSLKDCIRQWKTYADALSSNLSLPYGANFWALSIASNSKWNLTDAFNMKDGLQDEESKIKAVSAHYYQTTGGSDPQDTLLNHSQTATKSSSLFRPAISYLQNLSTPLPLILGEVGSALGNGHKDYELQASLVSAIWTVDWMLYVMTMGVQRVNMQMTTHATFTPWQPVPAKISGKHEPVQVLGGWYGHVFVADIMNAAKGKKLQVAELGLGGEADHAGSVVAYSIYHDEALAQVVLINEDLWTSGRRHSRHVTLEGLEGVSNVKIQRLTGDNGTTIHDISWAGQRWTAEKKGVPFKVGDDASVREMQYGAVEVEVKSTEALLLSLEG